MFQFPFGSFLVKEAEGQRASSLIKRFGVLPWCFFPGSLCLPCWGWGESGCPRLREGVSSAPAHPAANLPPRRRGPSPPVISGLDDAGYPEKPDEDPTCRYILAPASGPLEDACLGGVLLLNLLISRKLKTGATHEQISARCLCPN